MKYGGRLFLWTEAHEIIDGPFVPSLIKGEADGVVLDVLYMGHHSQRRASLDFCTIWVKKAKLGAGPQRRQYRLHIAAIAQYCPSL
jgi:hypothetical protein